MRRRITFIKKIKQIFLKQETYVSTFFIECDDGTYGTNCGSNCGHCYLIPVTDTLNSSLLKKTEISIIHYTYFIS